MVESLRQILQQQVIRGRSMPNITVLWLIMQIGWNKYKKLYNNICEVISKPVVKEKDKIFTYETGAESRGRGLGPCFMKLVERETICWYNNI